MVDLDGLFAIARLFKELGRVVFDTGETERNEETDMFL